MALPDLNTALYSKLSNDSGVSALVGTKIYSRLAPSGTDAPYIVFYLGSGLSPKLTSTGTIDDIYRVDSWSLLQATTKSVHDAVHTALDEQALTISGWTNYRMQCVRWNEFTETFEGKQYHRYVWDVRIRASKD